MSSGDGFQTRSDPEDPTIVYGQSQDGNLVRNDLRTGQSKGIRPRVGRGSGDGSEDQQNQEEEHPAEAWQEAAASGLTTNPECVGSPQGGAGPRAGGPGGAGAALGGRGGGADADRPNWDAPYIISPHSHTRLYWGSQFLYRSDDRGDHWARVSPDLTRHLEWQTLPIMGKVWPLDGCAVELHTSTTALSNIVSIDESPLLEGLIYVGTDDGLLQVTEDGGQQWRKVEDFPAVPKWAYVSDIFASPRDANVVFVALNNWQRGDFKPYLLKSADRGRTFTSIASNLPARNDVWSVIQDHVNGNLLFAGTEFGVFASVDGGGQWVPLRGGLPPVQVRDMAVQKRESDLVLGTFGRGFWVLDDYSALRDLTSQSLAETAQLYPIRDAYLTTATGERQASEATWVAPNPAIGAVFTYSVGQSWPADAKLVLNVNDDNGRQIRRIDLTTQPGLRRVVWNLRGETATPVGPAGAGRVGGRGGRGGGPGAAPQGATGAAGAQAAAPPPAPPVGGARGGAAPLVDAGNYVAVLAKVAGDQMTPVGRPQSFHLVPVPPKNY